MDENEKTVSVTMDAEFASDLYYVILEVFLSDTKYNFLTEDKFDILNALLFVLDLKINDSE